MDQIDEVGRGVVEAVATRTRWWLSDRARVEAERRTIGRGARDRGPVPCGLPSHSAVCMVALSAAPGACDPR